MFGEVSAGSEKKGEAPRGSVGAGAVATTRPGEEGTVEAIVKLDKVQRFGEKGGELLPVEW